MINDNRRLKFPLGESGGSWLCDDPALYDSQRSIPKLADGDRRLVVLGDVRPTDVAVLTFDSLQLPGGVLPTAPSALPAGPSAIWSFAEVLRRGCQQALDIHPDELNVGLQPATVNDMLTAAALVSRVELAQLTIPGAGPHRTMHHRDRQ